MTIRPVHRPTGYAYTLDEYRELMANRTRPLTGSGHIGSNPTRRNTDAAASSAFDTSERPSTKARWRPVGPRGHPTDAEDRRADATRRGMARAKRAADGAVRRSPLRKAIEGLPIAHETENRQENPR